MDRSLVNCRLRRLMGRFLRNRMCRPIRYFRLRTGARTPRDFARRSRIFYQAPGVYYCRVRAESCDAFARPGFAKTGPRAIRDALISRETQARNHRQRALRRPAPALRFLRRAGFGKYQGARGSPRAGSAGREEAASAL